MRIGGGVVFLLLLLLAAAAGAAQVAKIKMELWRVYFTKEELVELRSLMKTSFGDPTSTILDREGKEVAAECWENLYCFPYADKTLMFRCSLGCPNMIEWCPSKCEGRSDCVNACKSIEDMCQRRCDESWELAKDHIPEELW